MDRFLDWLLDGWGRVVLGIVLGIVLVIALVFVTVAWSNALNEKREWCESQGGHVTTNTQVGTGTGISPSNGQVVVTTTTTTMHYCLTDDGRILDIW